MSAFAQSCRSSKAWKAAGSRQDCEARLIEIRMKSDLGGAGGNYEEKYGIFLEV